MRALNIEELSAVSGGQSNEAEVVVTAERRNPNSIYMSDIAMTGMSLGDYLFGMQMDADNFSWYNVAREVVEWGTALGVYGVTKNAPAAGAGGIAAANLFDLAADAAVNAHDAAWGSYLTNIDNQVRQGALRSGWNAEAGVP